MGRSTWACARPSTLLDQTLQEEKATDEALTELAEAALNQEARQAAE